MQVANVGLGGVLLRWPDADAIPTAVDLFSDGIHVARVPLLRFALGRPPAFNLIDSRRFLESIADVALIEGQLEQAGWGSNVGEDWSVEGENTPFCFREHNGDFVISRYDLSYASGLATWRPDPDRMYSFGLDLAQHRCGVGLAIEWLDSANDVIGVEERWREAGPLGGRSAADYTPLVVTDTCPAAAEHVRLVLLQGPPTEPPDAYVFFRNPVLIEGEPAERLILPKSEMTLEGDLSSLAILPLGDQLALHAGPFELGDGLVRQALPDLIDLRAAKPRSVAVTINGGFLEACGSNDVAQDALLIIDDVLIGIVELPADPAAKMIFPLPLALRDEESHWIEVRALKLGETLHAGAHRITGAATPANVLQTYTSRIVQPAIIPVSSLRYEAIEATLARLGRCTQVDPALLAEISACHSYVLGGPQEGAAQFVPRSIPASDEPQFSIIVPAHNEFYFTYFCLSALIYNCAGMSFEVILVDDGSSDRTKEIEHLFAGIRVVRNATAQGFVGACNAGAKAARGDYLVFLNNDTEVTGNWLEELYLPFTLFEEVGLTGSRLVYPDGRLQEAGCIIWATGRPWNYGRDANAAEPEFNYTRQVDYCSGAALMISREAWGQAGGFACEFAPAYYEDTDLAFRVRELGWRVVYAAKSTVIHYEGVSNGVSAAGGGLKRYQEINRGKFETKWQHSFATHRAEGERPDLEKDRGIIGRALVLDYQTPRFDKDAGSFAISQEIRLLQSAGYKVTFSGANMAHLGMYTDALQRGGVEHLHAPFYCSMSEIIDRRCDEFDLFYIHRFTTARGLIPLIRERAPGARILLNCADVHFLRELRAARVTGSDDAYEEALRTREAEVETFRQADVVLTYSKAEKAVIEAFLGRDGRVEILPWIAADAGEPVPLHAREGLAFLGSYDHPPNRDAVEFFLEQCWPAILAANPNTTFHVAGTGFERFKPRAQDRNVVVHGWIEDISQFLARRRLMVAPLRSGAGIKGKIIDSLNSGTPVVLSPLAAEGLPLGNDDAAIARSPKEWLDHVSKLMTSDDAWRRMAMAGNAVIRSHFSFEHAAEQFGRILDACGLANVSLVDGVAGGFAPAVSYRDFGRLRSGIRVLGTERLEPSMLATAAE